MASVPIRDTPSIVTTSLDPSGRPFDLRHHPSKYLSTHRPCSRRFPATHTSAQTRRSLRNNVGSTAVRSPTLRCILTRARGLDSETRSRARNSDQQRLVIQRTNTSEPKRSSGQPRKQRLRVERVFDLGQMFGVSVARSIELRSFHPS